MSFQEKLEHLDEIMTRLESEPLPLDEALCVFEEGVALVREAEVLLKEVEQRVTLLAGDEPEGEEGELNDGEHESEY